MRWSDLAANCGVEGDVGVPDDVGGPVVGRSGDAVGELLDVAEGDPAFLGFGEELDGGDLVAVLVEVGAPGLDDGLWRAGVDDAVGVEQDVDGDLVDDAVVGARAARGCGRAGRGCGEWLRRRR